MSIAAAKMDPELLEETDTVRDAQNTVVTLVLYVFWGNRYPNGIISKSVLFRDGHVYLLCEVR